MSDGTASDEEFLVEKNQSSPEYTQENLTETLQQLQDNAEKIKNTLTDFLQETDDLIGEIKRTLEYTNNASENNYLETNKEEILENKAFIFEDTHTDYTYKTQTEDESVNNTENNSKDETIKTKTYTESELETNEKSNKETTQQNQSLQEKLKPNTECDYPSSDSKTNLGGRQQKYRYYMPNNPTNTNKVMNVLFGAPIGLSTLLILVFFIPIFIMKDTRVSLISIFFLRFSSRSSQRF